MHDSLRTSECRAHQSPQTSSVICSFSFILQSQPLSHTLSSWSTLALQIPSMWVWCITWVTVANCQRQNQGEDRGEDRMKSSHQRLADEWLEVQCIMKWKRCDKASAEMSEEDVKLRKLNRKTCWLSFLFFSHHEWEALLKSIYESDVSEDSYEYIYDCSKVFDNVKAYKNCVLGWMKAGIASECLRQMTYCITEPYWWVKKASLNAQAIQDSWATTHILLRVI